MNDIGANAFEGCDRLTSVTVERDNPTYSSVDGVLYDKLKTMLILCPEARRGTVVIPDTVKHIGSYSFCSCGELESVIIPSCVNCNGACAFTDCSKLVSVVIPSSVSNISLWNFSGCGRLTSICVDADNAVYSSLDGILYDKLQKRLIQCPAGKSGPVTIPSSVSYIQNYAFSGCRMMPSVVLPDGIEKIGEGTFSFCCALTALKIPSGVREIGKHAFRHCCRIKELVIPPNVTTIEDGAFSDCMGLASLTIPASVTNIGKRSFWGVFTRCNGLLSFIVDESNPSYSSRGGLLCSKDGTELIAGVNGDVTIPQVVTSIGKGAFSHLEGLTAVKIPSSVTNIGKNAFAGCTSLVSVEISAAVTNIDSQAFARCPKLGSIDVMRDGKVESLPIDRLRKQCNLSGWKGRPRSRSGGMTLREMRLQRQQEIVEKQQREADQAEQRAKLLEIHKELKRVREAKAGDVEKQKGK